MLVNPYRNTWVVAKEFSFRGVVLSAGSAFRIRTLHPRVWNRLMNDGSIVRKEDYSEETPEKVEEAVVPEVKVEAPKVEVKPAPKKKTPIKKKTKKEG